MYPHFGYRPHYSALVERILHSWDRAEMFILWGAAGSGKSTTVRRCVEFSYGSTDALYQMRYSKHGDPVRWEGFDPHQHSAVLFEEFRGQIDVDSIKEWVDRWPVRVRTFGGDRKVRPEQFWFTSNEDPKRWWECKYLDPQSEDRKALNLRTTASVCLHASDDFADAERFYAEYCQAHRPHQADQPGPEAAPGGPEALD